MNSKTNRVSATYQMASDSEDGNRMQVTFQDSAFDADDSDDVDGNVDVTFPALRFHARSADKKLNFCPGHCENENTSNLSPPVCDLESSFRANHVTVVDSSVSSVDQKFGFDALVNGTHSCFYESDRSSGVQDEVLAADDGFSSSQHTVNQEFLSFSELFKEPKQLTGFSSFESSGNLMLSEIQNDITDFQCNSPRISEVWPHSDFSSHEYAADVVYDCSAVQKHGANGICNELNADLPKSRCAVKLNDCLSRGADANEVGSECIKGSSGMEGTSHSVVNLCHEPRLGGTDNGIKRDVNCDGSEHEGNGCDIEESDEFYANSFPQPNVAVESSNSRSNMEESRTSREEGEIYVADKSARFEEWLDYDEVIEEGYVDEECSSEDEEEEQRNEDSQHMSGSENEERSNNKEPKSQESQVEEYSDKCASYVLEVHNEKTECSVDEEEEQCDQASGQEGGCEEVESSKEEELPDQGNVQERDNYGEDEQLDTDSVVIACFEDSYCTRGATHEITPEQRLSDEERWYVMEEQKTHVLKCTDHEHFESSPRGAESRSEKVKQCLEEGEEKDLQNQTIDRTEVLTETEKKGLGEEKKEQFQAVETGTSEVAESDDDGVLSNPKETTFQVETEEERKNDKERKEEIQSGDKGKEEIQIDDGKKEEIQRDDEVKKEIQTCDEKKEEIQSDDEKKEEFESDDEVKEEIQSSNERKEEIQTCDEKKEEIQIGNERKEEIQSDDEVKEEFESDDEVKEEIQSGDEKKEEIETCDEKKEEIQSDDEGKEEIQSGDEVNEEIQSGDERKEEIKSGSERKEEVQSREEGKEEIQSDDEVREEIHSRNEVKEEIHQIGDERKEVQSGEEGKEEIQSDDEVKEEIQSGDEKKGEIQTCDEVNEEIQSGDERKKEIRLGYERKEEIQSDDEGKEEIQSDDEVKEEVQSGSEKKEEIQSGSEKKEEIQSDDEVNEEVQSGSEKKQEVQSGSEKKEEIQSDSEKKEEIQSDDEVNEEIQSGDERKEEFQSCEEGKEEIQSGNEVKEEIQSVDERKEIHDDSRKTKRPTFLSSPCNNNFHPNFQPFILSCSDATGRDEENQLQHETKETELQGDDVKGDESEDVAIKKKLFSDSIKKALASEDKTELQKHGKDKNDAGWINLPCSLRASEKKNHRFVLNLGLSNSVTQTGNNNSFNDRVETNIPGTKKVGQLPCRETSSRFCPINLDYVSSSVDTQDVNDVFGNESSPENSNPRDFWKSRCKESGEKDRNLDAKIQKSQSKNLSLSVTAPQGPLDERVELNDIPEKFLVPPVCVVVHNNIMTPQEDLGFAKVPGYVPRLDSMEEESEVIADSTPDELQPKAKQEVDEVAVDEKTTSVPETSDLESDRNQAVSLEEKHEEARVETTQSGARPKELPSSLQLPMAPSAPGPLSPKLQLSPKPQSKSARPNSLIGLSKPDVNLPSLKPAAHPNVATHEDSSELIRVKRQDIPLLMRQRFSFPTSGNSMMTEISLLTSPSTLLDTAERSNNKQSNVSTFPSSNEDLPASETRATSSSRPLAQRPTSWSQPPLKTKSVLPKRPNSLNITVSNVVPIRTQSVCANGLPDTEATTLGLQVPQGTPCLAGSMVITQPPAAVLPSFKEPPLAVPSDVRNNKSYRTGVPDSASRDSPASVSAMPPPISSNINLRITELGKVAPVWVPDGDAPRCMQCESRFTFTRRRHHCRACGKVFCSGCCNIKVKLGYLDQKEARVCSRCYQDLLYAQLYENLSASSSSSSHAVNSQVPAAESTRCSSSASSVPSAARGATTGNVVKKEKPVEPKPVSVLDSCYHGNSRLQEADGGKAGVHTAAVLEKLSTGSSKDNGLKSSSSLLSKATTTVPQVTVTPEPRQVTPMTTRGTRTPIWPDCNGLNLNVAVMTEASVPSKFTLLPNLKVSVSIVNLDCCMDRVCWCFVTNGLCAVGQDEVVIVLERLPDEERIPSDVFYHICDLYREAAKGNPVGYLGHTLVADGQVLLESADHAGFLYLRPTFQCLQKLPLPPSPYLFGILVHRMEVPWLQVFPIRLMLRLGAQYRYYPCPLVSMRFREPVYREVGHTIMNLLVDLRNFQYRLPRVDGLVVHMEDKKTFINLPRSRYRDIKRAFNNNNDHIVALEVSFSCVADSHLVCFQNPEGKYITQAINIQNRPRKITGASFVVFNGALRPIPGMQAKCSMVEDGLMVQVSPDSMHQLKQSISSAEDYSIGCGRLSGPEPEEWVILKWVDDDEKDVKTRPFHRIRSPIDGMVLDSARSRRICAATDYFGESLAIRWTEIFYLKSPADSRQENDEEFEEVLAQACCMALCHYLEDLQLPALTRIGLRVTLGSEQFGYKIGANCGRLPDVCLSDLDSKLIPLLENPQGCYKGVSSTLELFFYLLELQQQPQPQHLSPEP